MVDDFGVTLNPLLLAGQVHGGAVQGIGQALMEHTAYDAESGQLVTRVLDRLRAAARAGHVPISFRDPQRALPHQSFGSKGAGEAASIGSCPAVMNAVADALWRAYRIRHLDMPATAERVWTAISQGRGAQSL